MKKKVLALLLCTAMTATLLTGCGGKGDDKPASESTEQSTPAPSEPTAPQVTAEEIPAAKYYFSFDKADGTKGITPTGQDKSATPILFPVDKEVTFIPGVKGDAVYIDGTYGLKLDVNGVGDTYSISYWMYATRFANYMPTLQFGPDVHGDATGGEHYLNITRSEWNPDGPTFPCVWARDANDDDKWPNWYPDEVGEHRNEWINLTLVVDPSKMSDDGLFIVPDFYINGELQTKPVNIVSGLMSPSDNFDFLLGINYWDAIYKGAFDEVYVFDTTLTAGQVKALYEAGDPNVKFEAPERVVEVKANPDALEAIGSMKLDNGWWQDWTSSYEIPDGTAKVFKLKNFSSGAELWHNYVMVFTNEKTEAHTDPNANEGVHKEWAAVRADAFGWGYEEGDAEYTTSWGNWDTWRTQAMVDADVTITVKREGNILNITAENVDYNGTNNQMNATVKTAMTDADPCYLLFTCEASYVELLAVEEGIEVKADPNAIESIGTPTYALGFWGEHTNAVELADGATKTVTLKNYSDGVNNWDNYVIGFTNTKTTSDKTPSADNYDGYMEYAVVRADAYGWGDPSYAGAFENSWNDWEAWLDAMRAADVTLVFTRNGGEIVVDTTMVDRRGVEYTSKATITSTLTAGDPCYFFFTGEACYVEILSVK